MCFKCGKKSDQLKNLGTTNLALCPECLGKPFHEDLELA
jgi:DNA-directed RNA polymerase subunit RPC12/RpoP